MSALVSSKKIRLGFVPLTDSAPLVMARELGLFEKHGLSVELRREPGWATVRERILYGELDAAHAVAGMPFALSLGLSSVPCPCLTGLVLSLHGNAITLSTQLCERGISTPRALLHEIQQRRSDRTFTFGVAFPFSSHNFLLRQWLLSGGVNPDRDVRIVVVPPPQMCLNLKAGHLDGFCVGEPWNTVAQQSGAGTMVATSAQLAPLHPEKVLLVRDCFATTRPHEHLRLIAALLEACAYCDQATHWDGISAVLARREYLNLPATKLQPGGLCASAVPEFHIFHSHNANEPTPARAAWVLKQLALIGAIPETRPSGSLPNANVFRHDLYDQARQLLPNHGSTEIQPHETQSRSGLSLVFA